jgi:DNA-binding Lrp family transcriptional regulator
MISALPTDSGALDELDRQIVRALQLSPRAPFRRIGEALGVSEQTIARRYRALHRAGVLHVIATVDPTALGESDWIVRIRSRPEATLDLGRALGQRSDIAWVSVSAGGAELVCAVRSHSREAREQLLIDRLPRTSAVLDLSASVILRHFVGGSASDWLGVHDVLTAAQERALQTELPRRTRPEGVHTLEPSDYAMLDVLGRDGRASYATLAKAAGTSEARATRRLNTLLRAGVVYLDIDLAGAALGFPTTAYLWLAVAPARLDDACRTIATHGEAPFVAAISGRANVVVSVTCRSLDHLYRYVTERVGPIDGVQSIEVSPVLRRMKQGGTLVDEGRLLVT